MERDGTRGDGVAVAYDEPDVVRFRGAAGDLKIRIGVNRGDING